MKTKTTLPYYSRRKIATHKTNPGCGSWSQGLFAPDLQLHKM